MEQPIAGYGWYIKRIDNALGKEANHNLQSHNLTFQQSHALVMLSHAPERTLPLKELESRFGAAQSTVAGLVARLEKKGLVEALQSPEDRRIKLVRLTDEGEAMHQNCHQDVVNSENRLTALLTQSEKETLLVLLQKLYEAVK